MELLIPIAAPFLIVIFVVFVFYFVLPEDMIFINKSSLSFSWLGDIINYNDPEYKQRKKLLAAGRSVIDKMDDEYDFDEIKDMLDGESEDSLITIEEKIKVLRAGSEDELNALWKGFKARKSRTYYYQAGEIVSIQKKKIKSVGNEFQIKVFYKEAVITPGKEKEYQQLKSSIDKLNLYNQLEKFIEQLKDQDEDLEKILKRFPKFESFQFLTTPVHR